MDPYWVVILFLLIGSGLAIIIGLFFYPHSEKPINTQPTTIQVITFNCSIKSYNSTNGLYYCPDGSLAKVIKKEYVTGWESTK